MGFDGFYPWFIFSSLSVLCIVDEMWSASFQSLTPLLPFLLSGLLQGDEFYLFRLFSGYSLFSIRIIINESNTLVNNSFDLDQAHVTNTIISSSSKTKKKNQLKTAFERWSKEIRFWKKTWMSKFISQNSTKHTLQWSDFLFKYHFEGTEYQVIN